MKAREGPVQVGKAGRHAGYVGAGHGQLLQPVEHIHQDLGKRLQALGGRPLAEGVDALFCQVEDGLGRLAPLLDQGRQFPGRLGDAAQERLVLDDADVLGDIGGGGGDLHELEQVVAGGVLVVDPPQLHLVQHRPRVDGGGEAEHGVDGLINIPVGLQIEVLAGELLHHVGDAAGVDEHGPQDRLLSLDAVGDLAEK